MYRKPCVLLADDDADERLFFQLAMERLFPEVEVKFFCDGDEALKYLACCPLKDLPNLIVIDYSMPNMNGADLLLHLSPIAALAPIPKVIWSTSSKHFSRVRLLGATECVIKPTSVREMDQMIRRLVGLLGPISRA